MARTRRGEFDVFISYSSKNKKLAVGGQQVNVVDELKRELERHRHPTSGERFKVCTDHEDFEMAAKTEEAIRASLDRSDALLVLCSASSSRSQWVRFEIDHFRRTQKEVPPLAVTLDRLPEQAFPDVFPQGSLAANLGVSPDTAKNEWRRQLRNESHKLVARVWEVPVAAVHDRYTAEQKARRRSVAGSAGIGVLLLGLALVWGVREFSGRSAAERLGAARRYAADMVRVQAAWTEGNVALGKTLLESHLPAAGSDDLRGFEWFSYWGVLNGSLIVIDRATPVFDFAGQSGRATIAYATDSGEVKLFALGPTTHAREATITRASLTTLSGSREGGLVLVDGRRALLRMPGASDLREIPLPPGSMLQSLALSIDGRHLAVARNRGGIELYRMPGPVLAKRFLIPGVGGTEVLFNHSSSRLAAIRQDGTVAMARTAGTDPPRIFKAGRLGQCESAAFIGEVLAIPAGGGLTTLDFESDTVVQTSVPGSPSICAVAGASDPHVVATAGNDRTVRLWYVPDVRSSWGWRDLGSFKGHRGMIVRLEFAPNDQFLASFSLANDLIIWQVDRSGRSLVPGHRADVMAAAIEPNDHVLISADHESTIRRSEIATGKSLWSREAGMDIRWLSISPDGANFVTAGWEPGVRTWEVVSGHPVDSLGGFGPAVYAPRGGYLAWVAENGSDVLIRAARGSPPEVIRDSAAAEVTALAFSPEGSRLVIGDKNGLIRVWNVESGAEERRLAGHTRVVDALAFSPDGRLLASGGIDGLLILWNSDTGQQLEALPGHVGGVYSLAFSPDRKTLASGGRDGTVKLWNTVSRQLMVTFYGHTVGASGAMVHSVSFTSDNRKLLSTGSYGLIYVWKAADRPLQPTNSLGAR